MGRNPKDSKWYATSDDDRNRKPIRLTLSAEALEKLARLGGEGGRSALVERMILAWPEEK